MRVVGWVSLSRTPTTHVRCNCARATFQTDLHLPSDAAHVLQCVLNAYPVLSTTDQTTWARAAKCQLRDRGSNAVLLVSDAGSWICVSDTAGGITRLEVVFNPATGEVLAGRSPVYSAAEVDSLVRFMAGTHKFSVLRTHKALQ